MGVNRKQFLSIAAGAAVAGAILPEENSSASSEPAVPFSLRGVYFHDGFAADSTASAPLNWNFDSWRRQLDWLHACGINTVEFATMLEFNRIPSTDLERTKISDRLKLLKYAHSIGMKFGYLLTNTVISTVPESEPPGHQALNRAVTLCPRIPGNFEKTIAIPRFYMETYKEADFFEEFAADWGGCNCGQCDVSDYLRYVRALAEHLTELRPKSRICADTWCISFWRKDPMAHGWKEMFDREISGSRSVIDALPTLPHNVDLALPCHHLYRPLAFESYGGKQNTPVFPTPADIDRVRKAGRTTLAWPHFVMDDDMYRVKSWGIVHSEVRYIQALLQSLRHTGIDRVIGNLYLPHLQLSNTYAYGRLLHDPDCEVTAILQDFARIVAHREDVGKLLEVMVWLENNSYWQIQMPEDGRLPYVPCRLDQAGASRLADQIRPGTYSHSLPVSSASWLANLRRSIARMDWTASRT